MLTGRQHLHGVGRVAVGLRLLLARLLLVGLPAHLLLLLVLRLLRLLNHRLLGMLLALLLDEPEPLLQMLWLDLLLLLQANTLFDTFAKSDRE